LGLIRVWEDSGVARGISKLLKPIARRLFKTNSEETLNAACMNLSVNLLGISGAATPYGVKAANLLDKTENAEYSSTLLFVINATSIQLLPTSIVGVRASLGALTPSDIILPSLLTTLFSTLLGVVLTKAFFFFKEKFIAKKTKPTNYIQRVGVGTE
jgi:spore maturation protein A